MAAIRGSAPDSTVMNLLSIETSADACSISLITGEDVISRETEEPRSHARMLVPLVQELMREASVQLDGISVDQGPGSYTGLRIGVSTAKGLAYALDCPLYAISSLELLAAGIMQEETGLDAWVRAILPARGSDVYTARFRISKGRIMERTAPEAQAVDQVDLAATDIVVSTASAALDALSFPSGAAERRTVDLHSSLAATLLRNQSQTYRVEDALGFEPMYVRDFVARKPAVPIFDRLPF